MGGLTPINSGTLGVLKGAGGSLGVPFGRSIFLINIQVAGTFYVDDIQEFEPELIVGERLLFLREPKNEIDELAILVKDLKGRKIGYVPRRSNPILARLMDAGKLIYGKIQSKQFVRKWLKIDVDVFLDD